MGILACLGEPNMPWKEETIMSIKEEFIKRALAKDVPFSQLCDEYQITRKTGYRLINGYHEIGMKSLLPKSKKPLSSPYKTDSKIEEAIVTTRFKYPTWGARKIIRYLTNKGMQILPAPSTVTAILKRYNLISIEESLKRQKLIRFERESPNNLWQMDFKGKFQLLTKQPCYPLTIIDDHSRFSLCIKASQNEQFLPVKKRLINVFQKYGLPDQINVDNGNPWGNSKLLRHTALTVWLMQLGIRISHSRPRHPQTNGKLERFHRTLKNDLILRHPMRSFSHAQKLFDNWRQGYNHERPHEAIDMDVPANRYQASKKQLSAHLPPIEYNGDAIVRKVRGNGYISYKNEEYLVGEAFKKYFIEVKQDEMNRSINLYFGQFQIYTYDY
jgi:transposase InsO family protein